jgi:RNA polymerase sigma-70 factor (ECF subfamily)
MTDQASLLELARERDPKALAQIYDSYAAKIYAYIYRHVGDPHRAEDLTSSVFLKMLEALERDKFARDALQSWLYRIAHNIIIDDVRKRQRRPISALHDSLALPPESNPDFMVSQRLENEELLQAIDQLTDVQRSVIILRFGEGMTAPQVATVLDKTEEAVRALQRRGLANLRKYYTADTEESQEQT